MVDYIESLIKGVQPWRRIDNMLVSSCIQQIQKDIRMGRPEAISIIEMLGNTREEQAELFFAWRVRLIDRMMAEHDKNNLGEDNSNPIGELAEDVEYYKALLHKDRVAKEERE